MQFDISLLAYVCQVLFIFQHLGRFYRWLRGKIPRRSVYDKRGFLFV